MCWLCIVFNKFFMKKVYLAMEAGYMEKVEELCERYSLEGFINAKGTLDPSIFC